MRARHEYAITEKQANGLEETGVIRTIVFKQTSIWGPGNAAYCDLDWNRAEAKELAGIHYLLVPFIPIDRDWGQTPESLGTLVPRWGIGDVMEVYVPGSDYRADVEILSVVPEREGNDWMWVISTKPFQDYLGNEPQDQGETN